MRKFGLIAGDPDETRHGVDIPVPGASGWKRSLPGAVLGHRPQGHQSPEATLRKITDGCGKIKWGEARENRVCRVASNENPIDGPFWENLSNPGIPLGIWNMSKTTPPSPGCALSGFLLPGWSGMREPEALPNAEGEVKKHPGKPILTGFAQAQRLNLSILAVSGLIPVARGVGGSGVENTFE